MTLDSNNNSFLVSPTSVVKPNRAVPKKGTFDPIGEEIRKLEQI